MGPPPTRKRAEGRRQAGWPCAPPPGIQRLAPVGRTAGPPIRTSSRALPQLRAGRPLPYCPMSVHQMLSGPSTFQPLPPVPSAPGPHWESPPEGSVGPSTAKNASHSSPRPPGGLLQACWLGAGARGSCGSWVRATCEHPAWMVSAARDTAPRPVGCSLSSLGAGRTGWDGVGGTGARPGQDQTRPDTQPAVWLPSRLLRFLSVSLPVWPKRPLPQQPCAVSAC